MSWQENSSINKQNVLILKERPVTHFSLYKEMQQQYSEGNVYNGKSYISKFSSKEVLWLVTELKGSAGSVPIIIRLILDLVGVASSYCWEGKRKGRLSVGVPKIVCNIWKVT